ncbi:MAG: hypothetical protein M3Q07_07065 [Pseudobdellovibrionaceae bacterium]|nr:hypothetical protein [Pseudobdellovibrionaceae bacterium]
MLRTSFAACFLFLSIGQQSFAQTVDTQIGINVQTILGSCSEAAQACGRLYGDVFNATVQPIQDSCSSMATGCGEGLCRHKVNLKMVDQIKASLNPEYEDVNGEIKAKITGSFTFSHENTTEVSCEWPGAYEDVKFVAKEAWLAAKCTEAVTQICRL